MAYNEAEATEVGVGNTCGDSDWCFDHHETSYPICKSCEAEGLYEYHEHM